MAQFSDPLSHVRVAAPCRADWELMHGNERVRFCDRCSMNVYNLSNMSKRDAESLILNAEGRLCVRYYSRADGTILTANCPVGLQAIKRRVSGISKAVVSSVLSFFAGIAVLAGLETAQSSLDAATEVGLDLIDPVPLVEPMTAPGTDSRFTTGLLAVESTEGWIEGESVNGQLEFHTQGRLRSMKK